MPLRLFVNELSFPAQECAFEQAAERLESFVDAVRAAKLIDPTLLIDASVPLSHFVFAANWPLAALRNQGRCRETGLYIQRLEDRAPFSHALAEVPDGVGGCPEYRIPVGAPLCAGEISVGMGLAHGLDGLAISLATHHEWKRPSIELECDILDAAGNVVTTPVVARNALDASGVGLHAPQLAAHVRPSVDDGADLWTRRAELFPNLRFIPRVEPQLRELHSGNPLVAIVFERLLKLDRAIYIWRETGVDHPPYSYFIRREPSGREKYAWFPDDDGTSRLFSLHGDYAPGENRYHFLVEEAPVRNAVVGYIGRKLGI